MKSSAEYKRDERKKKRSEGLVLKQIWVNPEVWAEIQEFIKEKHKEKL